MNQVSKILRRGEGRYFHWCPLCEEMHPLPDSWTFNGSIDKPTFSPSFAQTFIPKKVIEKYFDQGGVPISKEVLCHYIITDGMINYCGDSWHRRSDTVPMPEIPPHLEDDA